MIAVFTPTRSYGGLCEQYKCLLSQTVEDEIVWIIADELFDERREIVKDNTPELRVFHLKVKKDKDKPHNLARCYNVAMDIARENDADLFVSLQDYFYVPPSGLRKFKLASTLYSESLLAGMADLYAEPGASAAWEPRGLWTIFPEGVDIPWGEYKHYDVRRMNHEGRFSQAAPVEWESCWAAIPRTILYDDRLEFDEFFDHGIAYENSDYAMQATRHGYSIAIDLENVVRGYPHRSYWPELWEEDLKTQESGVSYNEHNRLYFEGKWSTINASI